MKQQVKAELFYGGVWNDVTTGLLQEESMVIQRGDGDESAAPRPATVAVTFSPDTNRVYDPTNPTSPLYGLTGRNTPMRVWASQDGDGAVYQRNQTEVTSWSPDQTVEFTPGPPVRGRAWTEVDSGGILRRLSASEDPIRSALYRKQITYPTADLVDYWPGEDGRAAQQMTSAVAGGTPGRTVNVSYAAGDSPGGSDDLISLLSGGSIDLTFRRPPGLTATSGWEFGWVMRLDAFPVSGPDTTYMTLRSSNGYRWQFQLASTGTSLVVVNDAGTTVGSGGASFGSFNPANWMSWRILVSVAGGTVTWGIAFYEQGQSGVPVLAGFGGTFAGSIGYPQKVTMTATADTTNAGVGQFVLLAGTGSNLTDLDRVRAFAGYPGETAGARFLRLTLEEGIARTLLGTASATQPMGPQRSDSVMNLLKEIRDTEDALIYDARTAIGLIMRSRAYRYNRPVLLALTFGTNVAPPLARALDDKGLWNDVTVSQRDGGSAQATQTTGLQSIQAPPAGAGRVGKTISVNINNEEQQLGALAGWWLQRGTLGVVRYPSITVDLDAHPELRDTVRLLDVGDRLTLTGASPVPGDTADMFVVGFTETIESHRRKITFTTAPNVLFTPAVYAAAGASTGDRYDSRTTTLATAATSTATALALTTVVAKEVWSTTPGYKLRLGGEVVTVTAMTAAAGTGPYTQTATVTRSTNGVVKAQTAGTEIHVEQQARYGL